MEEQNKGLNIRMLDLWHIVKGSWIVLLATLIVVTSGTYIFMVATHEDEYTAEVTLWASPSSQTSSEVNANKSLMDDYQVLVKSDVVINGVKKELSNMNVKNSVMRSMLSVSVKGSVMTLSITANNADRAKEIAEAWCKVFCAEVNNVSKKQDASSSEGSSSTENERISAWGDGKATLPSTAPSNPVRPVYALLIGVLATILVYVAYLIRFILDDKITAPEDVEKYLGLNVLGAVPDKNTLRRRRVKPD